MGIGMWDRVRAGLLVEADLRKKFGRPIPRDQWPPALRHLRGMPVFRRIAAARTCLLSMHPDISYAILVCDALVGHIATFREEELSSFQERSEFVKETRKVWPVLQRIGLARAEIARTEGELHLATDLERKLLLWIELFENRLMLEELHLTLERVEEDDTKLGDHWKVDGWGLSHPWDRRELAGWSESHIATWFRERKEELECTGKSASQSLLKSHFLGPSESSGPVDNVYNAVTSPANRPISDPLAAEAGPEPATLIELVPPRCVWIRCLFDDESRLRWWAWAKTASGLERLASGISSPGARKRLESANTCFDELTKANWKTTSLQQFAHLTEALRDPRRFVTSVFANEQHRQQFYDGMTQQFQDLSHGWPKLTQSGRFLLDWLMCFATKREPFPEEAWTHWTAELDTKRRGELHDASRRHLAALMAEWDLSDLWNQSRVPLDWQETDILFQAQGPLLTMPLAWVDFGGKPLFEQTASTSTAISLTLREYRNRRVGHAVQPTPKLLTILWEDEKLEKRRNSHGLPLLHAGLRCLAERFQWETWTLGDEPKATIPNLSCALREKFGVVVVGAHGVVEESPYGLRRAGVCLANNELWAGDGTDLSDVDLLVLACCTIGRLDQRAHGDVEGLYARLATHGARCVVAARWPVADQEAAVFVVEFVREYLDQLHRHGVVRPFDRARALNRARRKLIHGHPSILRTSFHVAAAFDMYGLG